MKASDKRPKLRRTKVTRRVVLVIVCLVLLMTSVAAVSWAKKAKGSRLVYSGGVVSNALSGPESCYDHLGIYAGLGVELKRVQPLAELKTLASRNRPTNAVLHIGAKRYSLSVDKASSGVYRQHVTWNYKLVKLPKTELSRLVGKQATIAYKMAGKAVKTAPFKVDNGDCI